LFEAKGSGSSTVVLYDPDKIPDLTATDRIERLERQGRLAAVRALAAAVDARDASTQDHSHNVAGIAGGIARHLRLDDEATRRVETAALLHDVGKIAVSDALLKTDTPLSASEQVQVRDHVALGQQILAAAGLEDLTPIVRTHHECWDGSGFPDGLRGDEIPLEARILAVSNAFESLTTDAAGRIAMDRDAALALIQVASGAQFDPTIVQALSETVGSDSQTGASAL